MTNSPTGNHANATINVAFWNVQNLFDVDGSPLSAEHEYTPVNGWNRPAFERRVGNLTSVIQQLFDGRGPDLLGICEVENSRCVQAIVDALGPDEYGHAIPSDADVDGLDTALIFNRKAFELVPDSAIGHVVDPRDNTFDILEAQLKMLGNGSDLVVFVNHWHSRQPNCQSTEPFRVTAASHCHRLINNHLKLGRKEFLQLKDNLQTVDALNQRLNRNVLVMGTLNDEPWGSSVREGLQGIYSQHLFESGGSKIRDGLPSYKTYAGIDTRLFNPMWSLLSRPDQGTAFAEQQERMLLTDQFLLSEGLLFGREGLRPVCGQQDVPLVEIFRPDVMTTKDGRPMAYQRDQRSGYSDHFPITMSMQVAPT